MRPVPPLLRIGQPCRDVVEAMNRRRSTCALVIQADGGLAGIVTITDVTRRMAFQVAPDAPVDRVMAAPVHAINDDDYLYRALILMRRHGIHHMPVVTQAGRLAGLLDLYDAMAVMSEQLLDLVDTVGADDTPDGLRSVKHAQVGLAEDLFAIDVPAPEIQQLLTDVNRDIQRRAIQTCLDGMEVDGWGAPPVGFDVLVMGSGGRGESFLMPDQDNGFILDDYADAEHTRIDGFFIELAERYSRLLDAVGFPLCQGHVMATNPLWRKTLSQWLAQTTAWSGKRHFVAARLVGIVLDFRAVTGSRDLTRHLRAHVTECLGASRGFLRELYRASADNRTALGWFNWLILETAASPHRGKLNLKLNGVLPLVESVRLLALQAGVPETATLERIAGLVERGILDQDFREYLEEAFAHLTTLLLRQQIADTRAGRPSSHHIDPNALSARDNKRLVDALTQIEALRGKLRTEFTAEVF